MFGDPIHHCWETHLWHKRFGVDSIAIWVVLFAVTCAYERYTGRSVCLVTERIQYQYPAAYRDFNDTGCKKFRLWRPLRFYGRADGGSEGKNWEHCCESIPHWSNDSTMQWHHKSTSDWSQKLPNFGRKSFRSFLDTRVQNFWMATYMSHNTVFESAAENQITHISKEVHDEYATWILRDPSFSFRSNTII